jgi:two-component system chemotaxis response regulator CheY
MGTSPMKSLIVEDDFISRLLLETILSRFGQCHVAVNGQEAVNAFCAAQKGGFPYDLVTMDIMMPVMDGREALQKIRAAESASGILSSHGAKIVMTTALEHPKDIFDAFYALCDDYLVKPIDTTRLLEMLRVFALIS